RVRGAGYFVADGGVSPSRGDDESALARLRERATARYGKSHLGARIAAAEASLRSLAADTARARGESSPPSAEVSAHGVARRAAELVAEVEAFRVLEAAAPLRDGALVEPA